MPTHKSILRKLPTDLKMRIGYGPYGGVDQFFITEVDGTMAQLGSKLPSNESLRRKVRSADSKFRKMMKNAP